jgi:hypothetical protein
MKQVLNEELVRIREIMGFDSFTIYENTKSKQEELISEQANVFADLIQGAAGLGKQEFKGLSVIDDAVRDATENLSKTSKYVKKTYNTLEDFADAIARKEIAKEVAEDIAETIMKNILSTPEGVELVSKTWFSDNVAKSLQKTFNKIDSGEVLPPNLAIKANQDFQSTLKTINTGDSNVDNALRTELEIKYGQQFAESAAEGERVIKAAKELEQEYQSIREEAKNFINKQEGIRVKRTADFFGTYEKRAKELINTKGEYQARKFLIDNLQKPTIVSRIKNLFKGSSIGKFFDKLFSKKGVIWVLSGSAITFILGVVYYLLSIAGEAKDTLQGDTYTKLMKIYPIIENADKKLLNTFISDASSEDINNLLLKKEGYSLKYRDESNDVLGDVQILNIVTPSITYDYTLVKDTGAIDSKKTDTKSGEVETTVTPVSTLTNDVIQKVKNDFTTLYGDGVPKIKNIDVIDEKNVTVTFEDGSVYPYDKNSGTWK